MVRQLHRHSPPLGLIVFSDLCRGQNSCAQCRASQRYRCGTLFLPMAPTSERGTRSKSEVK